jgi:hypothetical protein
VTFKFIGARLSDSFIPLQIMAFRTRLLAPTTIELSGISSNRSVSKDSWLLYQAPNFDKSVKFANQPVNLHRVQASSLPLRSLFSLLEDLRIH